MNHVKFRGLKINNIGLEELCQLVNNKISDKGYICLYDVSSIMRAAKDKELIKVFNNSLLSVADGMPLAWYAKLLGCKKIERIASLPLMKRLMEDERKYKHFLLGDTEETLNQIITTAKSKNNELVISGYSPPFSAEFDEKENSNILAKIKKQDPDIIWVSLGGGKQDKWMYDNINKIDKGIMIGVGAAFRYYTGDLYTPPKFIQMLGLQWFFRLINERGKWIKRSFIQKIQFMMYFPWELIKNK